MTSPKLRGRLPHLRLSKPLMLIMPPKKLSSTRMYMKCHQRSGNYLWKLMWNRKLTIHHLLSSNTLVEHTSWLYGFIVARLSAPITTDNILFFWLRRLMISVGIVPEGRAQIPCCFVRCNLGEIMTFLEL